MSSAAIALVLSTGCGSNPPVHKALISGQGGFRDPVARLASDGDEQYCRAEVLRWQYDAPSATLKIADSRLLLDCCGRRAMHVERIDNIYEISERDEPDAASGRCGEACAFDFSIDIPEVAHGEVYLRLLRDIVDRQGGPVVVWTGGLGLAHGTGAVVLDDSPAAYSCQSRLSLRQDEATIAVK